MEQLFKSILEQDRAPIVVCDMESTVVYMNPSAIARYKRDLTGRSIKACHPPPQTPGSTKYSNGSKRAATTTSFIPSATTRKTRTFIWSLSARPTVRSSAITKSTNTETAKLRSFTIFNPLVFSSFSASL